MNSVAPSSSLIPVGSLAVLDIQVEKIEDQKLYMSCIAQSRDKQTVYASPLVKTSSSSGGEGEGRGEPKIESRAGV